MKKVCLIIIDGFGVAPAGPGNARTLANMPTIKRLEEEVPNCIMQAAGNAVGVPEGQMGNSEAGHLMIGAGRVVWQPLGKINRAVQSGEFLENTVLVSACERAAEKGVTLHLVGLYSTGGIHSAADHWHVLLKLAEQKGVSTVRLHLFADGRDMPEQHFCEDFKLLQSELTKYPNAKVSSMLGRLYMDRDKNYETRTKVAYDLFTAGKGELCDDLCQGAKDWYARAPEDDDTDYYIEPLKTSDYEPMREDDVVICVNFRSDRMRQIVYTFEDEVFEEFERPVRIQDIVCMGPYSDHLPIAFPPELVSNSLGEIISNAGLKQFRIAETDKMPHVTFFFNAQNDDPFPREDRLMVPSPKVPNYADTPEMSAAKLTDELLKRVESEEYSFILANFSNPDLVGHGGVLESVITACETVDLHLARLLSALEEHGYDWIVTSDHGNSEQMLYEDGSDCPTHTLNPVQTFVHSDVISQDDLKDCGGLTDIAPLVLKILGLEIPAEMQ